MTYMQTATPSGDWTDLVRRGAITEIVGRPSSGRTSLLLACLAASTRAGGVAALVDADGVFDPEGAATAGVDLPRLLWIRGAGRRDVALRATDLLVRCPGFAMIGLDLGEHPPRLSLASAFRWRGAVRRTETALVILSARRVVEQGAALAIRTVQGGLRWAGPGREATRLSSLRSEVQVLRTQGAHPAETRRRLPAAAWWRL